VLSRLENVGLGDLVLDLHDGPGPKGKLAQQFAKSLADAASARPTDMVVEQEQLVRRRDALVRRTAALHQKRDPWGISVYGLQAETIGVANAVRSEQRLGSQLLGTLSAEALRQAEANLERFVGIGGLSIEATGSPWLPALSAGTISTPEQATSVLDAMTTFTQHTLPEATQRIESALHSVGLTRPDSVADWARIIELLHRAEGCLEALHPTAFALDFEVMLAALTPATSGAFGRFWHRLFDATYRSAVRSISEVAKDPSANAAHLYAMVTDAKELLEDWQAACNDGGVPRLPPDLDGAEGTYGQLLAELGHLESALGQRELEELRPEQLADRLRDFIADRETLYKIPELHRLTVALQTAGLLGLMSELRQRNLTVDQAVSCLRFVWHMSILDAVSLIDPEVGTFDGPAHSRTVNEYRGSDVRHISTTPARIRRAVAEHVIAARDAYPKESQLVTHEAGKKRRHVPVRLLFQQAPHVLTALKPCWAMSPLVVASVLPVERCFDVVIFDEASQVTPESAVGALMRAGQAVVAGDPHQLPPTAFFASGSAADDEEEDEDEVGLTGSMTKDFESVLDVMGALLPPPVGTKRLNWHYRSRDERLIAFSNAQPKLYDWSLTTFPGADSGEVISHELVPFVPGRIGQEDSVSDEVEAVVQAVTDHAHSHPTDSLGVITMGIKHMERISEALRRARLLEPALDDYLDEIFYGTEKFFVKNLERVQGDERDAILISIGYGKNPEGRMLYRFGPLNTRARARIGVISSFSAADLDPSRLRSDGAQMLRDYLVYAESGGRDLGSHLRERDPLNPFEQDVLSQLTAAGLELDCQVGCSGYWIDFAAKHPTEPGRYVLAIEADGVMYHSSDTARDRDRLRQDHLERLGWKFHRIWSSEWFHHREREVERTLQAFNAVLADPDVPHPSLIHHHPATETLSPDGSITGSNQGRVGPRPWRPDGRKITEYPDFELVKLMRWIMSDGQLRTTDELIALGTAELGFKRRGALIVSALERAIVTAKE
jgi:very-short-patch-repair endonuclease